MQLCQDIYDGIVKAPIVTRDTNCSFARITIYIGIPTWWRAMSRYAHALLLLWTLCLFAQCLATTARTEPQTPGVKASVALDVQTPTALPRPHNEHATSASSSLPTTTFLSTSLTPRSANPASSSTTTPGTCAFASIDYVTRRPLSRCYTQSRPSISVLSAGQDAQDHASSNAPSTSQIASGPTSRMEKATHRVETRASGTPETTPEKTALALADTITSIVEIVQTTQAIVGSTAQVVAVGIATVVDPETESPLNDAKFLSFEDWKKQNLPRVPDDANTRQPRPSIARPGLDTALEGLGDEGEIVFDFSGFSGSMGPGQTHESRHKDAHAASPAAAGENEPTASTQRRRPRDAGKTCKERSNYASFDCGSSVLKTNPQGKKASSILVENKDSYMLNECSASNKFIIIELCDEIKIDTIVLANFEFFSSIFRTFKVSVSDRYPVRIDRWKDIGTFEARNTRDIQAFLVENHAGFARYVRIEFLTHFGSEFYCPVSLFRIHGVTAFEEYKLEQLSAEDREGDDDEDTVVQQGAPGSTEKVEPQASALPEFVTAEAASILPLTPSADQVRVQDVDPSLKDASSPKESAMISDAAGSIAKSPALSDGSNDLTSPTLPSALRPSNPSVCYPAESRPMIVASESTTTNVETPSYKLSSTVKHNTASTLAPEANSTLIRSESASSTSSVIVSQVKSSAADQSAPSSIPVGLQNVTTSDSTVPKNMNTTVYPSSLNLVQSSSVSASTSTSASVSASSTVSREPATQESFFKTIHKRLQYLEANSTLSLQYIESQSALLREAFEQVEKRQLAKTTTFLSILNATVSAELSRFQSEYEQLWQSTIVELASQRDEGRQERELLGERVKVLAEEMVNQKRLMAAQATILLLCLGLIVFSRFGGMSTAIDSTLIQGMQEIINKGKKMRAEEKDRLMSNRWRWESPWASPSRRSKGSGVVTPVARDFDRTGTSTPRSFEKPEGNSLDLSGLVDMPHHRYATLDGQEMVPGESSLKLPELAQVVQSSQTIQSAPTTPLSEMPPEETPEVLHLRISND